ncbi:hypothetical protein B7486_41405 [cyanobacterium TDX16]|nr:hypothetical protein B7486_41405 [cyanobacterium TDX16]
MKLFNSILLVLGSIGLLFLGAGYSSSSILASEIGLKIESVSEKVSASKDSKPKKGGQVVESGAYHLELVPEQEAKGTHLDFYLQRGDNHEAIPNAKVTAQVQMPDGTQKTLPLKYDAEGKHYAALLPGNVSGQYQVRVTADLKGEKVNGRFSFKR